MKALVVNALGFDLEDNIDIAALMEASGLDNNRKYYKVSSLTVD
jgi:hypothetical protein